MHKVTVKDSYIHVSVSEDELICCHFRTLPSLFVAALASFCKSAYTRPVLVRGSTTVKMSFVLTITMCSLAGYLNELDGPGGSNSVTLT